MALDSKIKVITHDIDATNVKVDIALTAFIKTLYPTYTHYLESLQASVHIKSLNFDTLVEKIIECEKLERRQLNQMQKLFALLRKRRNK